MKFATATGTLGLSIPYSNQKKVPTVNKLYIDNEIPEVSLVLMVFTACGKKEMVVPNAAIKPMISMYVILKMCGLIRCANVRMCKYAD
jgi:hypothetical protein